MYCAGGLLVPNDGFWHSSPPSEDTQPCPNTFACEYPNRTGAPIDACSFARGCVLRPLDVGVIGVFPAAALSGLMLAFLASHQQQLSADTSGLPADKRSVAEEQYLTEYQGMMCSEGHAPCSTHTCRKL